MYIILGLRSQTASSSRAATAVVFWFGAQLCVKPNGCEPELAEPEKAPRFTFERSCLLGVRFRHQRGHVDSCEPFFFSRNKRSSHIVLPRRGDFGK